MQRHTQEKEAATTVGSVPRAMTVAVMMLSIAKGGAFQAYGMVRSNARTRLLSSRPALADRVLSPQEYATGARPAAEGRPERNEASSSFFERMGRPRYIAAPMVEQSEAGESTVVRCTGDKRHINVARSQMQLYLESLPLCECYNTSDVQPNYR